MSMADQGRFNGGPMAVGGGRNAGILATQILAVGDARLQVELQQFKRRLREESRAKNKTLGA